MEAWEGIGHTQHSHLLPPCRHQQLQFRPSLEELRAKYYREMKKFICIPLHFKGVGEATSAALTIFPRMISRNAAGFTTVYRKVGVSTVV